jgi:hypothetical protein
MANIFETEANESAIQTIKETMKVFAADDGTPMVSFATNRGKGSGAQVMSVADFGDYVEAVSHYAQNGIDDIPTQDNLSPAETVHQTISMNDEGLVSFRVRSGKGAKPAKVALSEFSEIADLLGSTVSAVESAADRLTGSDSLAADSDDSSADDSADSLADEPWNDDDGSGEYEDADE